MNDTGTGARASGLLRRQHEPIEAHPPEHPIVRPGGPRRGVPRGADRRSSGRRGDSGSAIAPGSARPRGRGDRRRPPARPRRVPDRSAPQGRGRGLRRAGWRPTARRPGSLRRVPSGMSTAISPLDPRRELIDGMLACDHVNLDPCCNIDRRETLAVAASGRIARVELRTGFRRRSRHPFSENSGNFPTTPSHRPDHGGMRGGVGAGNAGIGASQRRGIAKCAPKIDPSLKRGMVGASARLSATSVRICDKSIPLALTPAA